MPNFLDAPEILPLPSLQTYASISFLLLSCALYYAFQISSEPDWKLNEFFYLNQQQQHHQQNVHQLQEKEEINITNYYTNHQDKNDSFILNNINNNQNNNNNTIRNLLFEIIINLSNYNNNSLYKNDTIVNELIKNENFLKFLNIINIMINEPFCVWTLINISYCLLILFGKLIQKLIFGELRQSEQQLLRDKFWNFLLYKFIFIFSVINVQYMDELILWCTWFSLLGFMYLLINLCKERYNYLINRPQIIISKFTHLKLLLLLLFILISTIPLIIISIFIIINNNFSNGLFLFCEIIMILLRTIQCLLLYLIYLWDLNYYDTIWEKRTTIIYYIEFIFDLFILLIDFIHHLHMLSSGNIILSVSSIVILIQMRSIFTDIIQRLRKHRNYLQVINLMEENFPTTTSDELNDENNDCAICWDRMENARKLPCGHIFHTTCLRSWLEQDTSCPTCRYSLRQRDPNATNINNNNNNNNNTNNNNNNGITNNIVQNIAGGTGFEDLANIANLAGLRPGNTRFFYFDGSRYATWLPSFSVEVTRPNVMDININASVTRNEQQIEHMARQVLEWFPQYSLTTILDDLRNTRSVELTIENILDGRLIQNSNNATTMASSSSTINTTQNQSQINSPNINNNNNINSYDLSYIMAESSDLNNDDDDIEILE